MADDPLLDHNVARSSDPDGQMHALVAFALALAKSHPDPYLLLRHFEETSGATLSSSEGLTSDNSTDVARHFSRKILAVLREAAAQHATLSYR